MTTAVEVKAGTTLASVTYTYDVFDNRIQENASGSSVPTQVTRFAYDGQNVWADLDGNNNLVMRRLFLNTVDSVAARITASGTVSCYLPDRLGSINVLTDATGAVIDRITYDAYGNVISQTNPSASDRYMFTGREFDPITGLQYNRARYYDPATGRWTSEDPLGFASGVTNLYRYVSGDPTNRTDPTGLAQIPEVSAVQAFPPQFGYLGGFVWGTNPRNFLKPAADNTARAGIIQYAERVTFDITPKKKSYPADRRVA